MNQQQIHQNSSTLILLEVRYKWLYTMIRPFKMVITVIIGFYIKLIKENAYSNRVCYNVGSVEYTAIKCEVLIHKLAC